MIRAMVLAGIMTVASATVTLAVTDDRPERYPATIVCDKLAEDSAAHVRLTKYVPRADGTIRLVYRCERKGY